MEFSVFSLKSFALVSRLPSLALPAALVSRLPSLALFLLALALSGCNSYRIVQTNQFMDEDGARITVDYGRAEKDHVNTFRSPGNGQELEFKSKLVIDVELPDGESFTAWQAMNMSGAGTLYRSDDDAWMVLAMGFTCRVAQMGEDGRYREVFKGVLCNTPIEKVEKDTRWRKLDTPAPRVKR